MANERLSRRDLIRRGSGAAAASLLGLPSARGDEPKPARRSRVVLVRRPDVLDSEGRPVAAVLREMTADALVALLQTKSAAAAWGHLFGPGDVVGVKSNVWAHLPTPPALEEVLFEGLQGAGVKPADIAADDRGVRDNPVFQRATALINVRPLRTHHWSGLGTCIKNVITFVPRPWEYHADACASLGALWHLPEVAGTVRLNVLVMLTPQFHSVGPHSFSRAHTWAYHGLIFGLDPVAVDATGARIIEAQRARHFGKPTPLSPPAHHIEIADTRYGIGVADPARIDLVRLGSDAEALI